MRKVINWLPLSLALTSACASTTALTPSNTSSKIRHAEPEDIIEHITYYREYSLPRISPDGKYISVLVYQAGKPPAIAFFETAGLKPRGKIEFRDDMMARDYGWVSNTRILVELSETLDGLSGFLGTGQLHAVNFDGTNSTIVFGYRAQQRVTGTRFRRRRSDRAFGSILHPLPGDPKHALIIAHPWARSEYERDARPPSIYQLDIRSGLKDQIVGPSHAKIFRANPQGVLKIALTGDHRNGYQWYQRSKNGLTWDHLPKMGRLSPDGEVWTICNQNRVWFLEASQNQPHGLYAHDLSTQKTSLVFQHSEVSPHQYIRDPEGRMVAVTYEASYPDIKYLTPEAPWAKLHQQLRLSFPEQVVKIVSRTTDGGHAIVQMYSDKDPGQFYLLNTKSMVANYLFSASPGFPVARMGTRKPFVIKAEDGLDLHGYLTIPPQQENAQHLPTIVIPHDGPASRDWWGFDPDAQLLASHGYLVIQVNFRGSRGYGPAFEKAGHKHWGTHIQDDIETAVRWAIQNKQADPHRIGIYGVGFGAYSALMSSIRYPERYQAVVGLRGFYDLDLAKHTGGSSKSKQGRDYLTKALDTDEETIRAQSPVFHAGQIRARVMLVHGKKDQWNPIEHSKAMKAALEATGNPPEWRAFNDEGYSLNAYENRRSFYRKMLAFFERHVKARQSLLSEKKL